MSNWSPVAILPNLFAKDAVGSEEVAFVSCYDSRVQAFCAVQPKFQELLSRFTNAFDVPLERKRHFLGTRQRWQDRALFRSLNMAAQAAQLPAGVGTTLYDLGRMSALWVSAFEILAHPRKGNSGLRSVYPLFERVSYLDRNVSQRRYAAYMNGKKPWPRRPLPCWLYGKLYQARCDFLHGNPLGAKPLYKGSKVSLFWLAPSLYRLALMGFLDKPPVSMKRRSGNSTHEIIEYMAACRNLNQYQGIVERALLRARKDAAPSARRH